MLAARSEQTVRLLMNASSYWYDFSPKVAGQADFSRRFGVRIETGQASFKEPTMFGSAVGISCGLGELR